MFYRGKLFSYTLTVFALVGTMFLQGCGDSRQELLNSGPSSVQESRGTQGAAYLILQPKVAGKLGLGDLIENTVRVVDGLVLDPNSKVETDADKFKYGSSGELWTYFGNYADYWNGEVQVKEATFLVDKYSVPSESGDVRITMTVYSGYSFDDVVVKFEPSGFNFLPEKPAHLKLKLRGKEVPEDVKGYHAHGAEVEETEITYEEHNGLLEKYVIVTLKVPGFSEYSLGGDDWGAPEAGTP
ncbi:MAG: hypothetical protein O2954_13255 [bacterium]|nr:hypothetical protein [bacterium]